MNEAAEGDSLKKMLKTIAAFASQDGGTVLIGVRDYPRSWACPRSRPPTSRNSRSSA
ncbi:ATP-binding protein [Streptomyces sp. ID05-04B]|uniref:ATP-binding protein n=1 Tax=unclassified Streptomyces TaxID=2593676 RepID=UPI0020B142DE|nr:MULTISPECIES: ATP-binding protein [unclassified Streptomyces]MDX5566105.1 ATP-binding protein [Streptomyces sp. ID05-04B]